MSAAWNGPSIEKLNAGNWQLWKLQIQCYLEAMSLIRMVDGDEKKPEGGKELELWVEKNAKAKYAILTTIESSILTHIQSCETSEEMWNKLHRVFEFKDSNSKLAANSAFHSFKYNNGSSMAEHVSALENLAAKLRILKEPVPDSMLVSKLLLDLPERFNGLIAGISVLKDEDRTFASVSGLLILEESRIVIKEPVEAFNPRVNPKYTKTREELTCYFCNKKGHYKRDYLNFEKSNRRTEFKIQSDNPEFDKKEMGAFHAGIEAHPVYLDQWIADSGASSHMTPRRDWFVDYQRRDSKMRIANGEELEICGKGKIGIRHEVNGKWFHSYLHNVLHLPKLSRSLFSVRV
ncbi:Retrovirus-related Pol polyprotein from transposon TNT 1-94 [Halotydeus destructor]|nr:Retrovirus-related Pol polyprotein from transposon TNT 1-94 [Halotydeus destructor]